MLRFLAVVLLMVFAVTAPAAPVPKALKKKPLRAKIEPLPGEKVYTADFDDVSATKVFERLEKQTGLMFISKDVPKLNISLHAQDVCGGELFAQLNDILYPQGWVVSRRTVSFSTIPVEALAQIDWKRLPQVSLDELKRRSQYDLVQVSVTVGEQGIDAGRKVAGGIKEALFEMVPHGEDRLILRGLSMNIQKFVDDMGDHIKK